MIRIIHVDDEIRQQQSVKSILSTIDEVELTAQFSDAEEALAFLRENEVDMAILDIEMPGKDGLWLANEIKQTGTVVVFLTAHTELALKAFEVCALHYIIKPITKDVMPGLIERYKWFTHNNGAPAQLQQEQISELLSNYLRKDTCPRRIFINNVKKTTVLNLDDVMYLAASGPYTNIKTVDGKLHTASKVLKLYAEALEKHPDFVRIHRANIVNKRFVKAILRDRHNIELLMADESKLQVSPNKREEIADLLMI